MIRWRYLVPRLLLAAALLFAIALLIDPLIKQILIRSGQSLLGAKVEIDAVITSLPSGRMVVRNLKVTNPRSPMKNLVEASEAHLHVDTKALLNGRLVVRDGSLRGVKFDTDRTTSGTLPDNHKSSVGLGFDNALPDWLDHFSRQLDAEWLEEFESVRVARELAERWPVEARRLLAEADALRGRVQAIRDAIEQARHKPLDQLGAVHRALQEAAALRDESDRMRRRLADLQEQMRQDQKSIEFARRRDIARIEQGLQVSRLDGQAVSEFLLGKELSPFADELLHWVSRGRKLLEMAGTSPRPARGRGVTMEFPRDPQGPDWLIERLSISGETEWRNRRVPFQGVLRAVSSEPAKYPHPSRLSLKLAGVHPAQLEIVADARQETAIQRLTFSCPQISLGKRSIGNERQLLVELDEGTGQLWMQIELQRDELNGRIVWKQEQIRLAAMVGDRYGGRTVGRLLDEALRDATHLHAVVELQGTVQQPQARLSASIGPQLAEAWNSAIRRELDRQRDVHVAKLQLQIAEQIAHINDELAARQQEILAKLDVGGELESFDAIARRLGTGGLPLNAVPFAPAANRRLETGMRQLENGIRRMGTRQ